MKLESSSYVEGRTRGPAGDHCCKDASGSHHDRHAMYVVLSTVLLVLQQRCCL